jgi:hypothetical protein
LGLKRDMTTIIDYTLKLDFTLCLMGKKLWKRVFGGDGIWKFANVER